jgi:hypothetical protein
MVNMAIQATEDKDGDGFIDQWGITTYNVGEMARGFVYSNGVSVISNEKDKFLYTVDTTAARRGLQYFVDLYNIHKVTPVMFNSYSYYMSGNSLFNVIRISLNPEALKKNIKSGVVCFPYGPDVDTYQNIWKSFFNTVSSMAENPGEICKVLQACTTTWTEDGSYVPEITQRGLPEYTYTERDSMACTEKLPPGKNEFYDAFPQVAATWTTMVNDLCLKGVPVSQVLDTYKQQALDGIRSVVGD